MSVSGSSIMPRRLASSPCSSSAMAESKPASISGASGRPVRLGEGELRRCRRYGAPSRTRYSLHWTAAANGAWEFPMRRPVEAHRRALLASCVPAPVEAHRRAPLASCVSAPPHGAPSQGHGEGRRRRGRVCCRPRRAARRPVRSVACQSAAALPRSRACARARGMLRGTIAGALRPTPCTGSSEA
eukprot:scaffold123610_cov25-Tisochrysis_lutea.AAC.5